jgi:hypothetical protein
VDATDVVEISQVLAQVFTGDAVFDINDFDRGRLEGLDAIRAMFEQSNPPYSVNIVNVVVRDGDEPRTAHAYSKNLGLLSKGRVGSASYEDDLVKTDHGWRVVHRLAIARREARP